MLLVVLPQQILAVVVAVGRAHDGVDVLAIGHRRIEVAQVGGPLVIEFDQNHGAVDPVVEHRVVISAADPGEPRLVEMRRELRSS